MIKEVHNMLLIDNAAQSKIHELLTETGAYNSLSSHHN
jgi:hypothetical protein